MIWRPHSDSAPGELRPPCTSVVTPLLWGHHATLVFIEKIGAPEQLCLRAPKSLIWHWCQGMIVEIMCDVKERDLKKVIPSQGCPGQVVFDTFHEFKTDP